MKGRALGRDTLNDIIRRVVEVAEPERIILFGSAARGEVNRHSDVDLLVVNDGADLCRLTAGVYRRLYGVGSPVEEREFQEAIAVAEDVVGCAQGRFR